MTASLAPGIPQLANGDVMDVTEFLRRYEASDDLEHVELIEGVVYMPSPISFNRHSRPHVLLLAWLLAYERLLGEEVFVATPASVILDDANAPEPDAMMY